MPSAQSHGTTDVGTISSCLRWMRSSGSNDIELAPQNPGVRIGMYSQTPPRNDSIPGRGQWNPDNAYRCAPDAENRRGRNSGQNRSDRLYDFFINRLRHPYELCPMLIALMVKPYAAPAQRIRPLAWSEWGLLRQFYASPQRRAVTAEGGRYERIGICTSESARGSETAHDMAARDRAGASRGRSGRAVRRRRVGGLRGGVHGGQLVRNQRRRAAMALDHRYGVALPDNPAPDHRRVLPGLVGKRQATTRLQSCALRG